MEVLKQLLSEELTLMLRTWNYHWNLEGAQFASLHKLLETQYDELADLVDEVAERIRALGGVAETKVNLEITKLVPLAEMLKDLISANEGISKKMRTESIPVLDKANDIGSVDLLTRALQQHDKAAWMLRASAK